MAENNIEAVVRTVSKVLNDMGYRCDETLIPSRQKGPVFSVGGCGC